MPAPVPGYFAPTPGMQATEGGTVTLPLLTVTQVAPYQSGPAGVHGVLGQAALAMAELGTMAGLEPVTVHDVAAVAPQRLSGGGVLALFTIGETPWSAPQRTAILDAVGNGRLAVLGIHAATDACRDWDDYERLVGARFDGHPWTQEFTVEVLEKDHPATAHFAPCFQWRDEVYLFSQLRSDATVLLQVADDQLDMTVPGARRPAHGFPLCWCAEEGRGRIFYTSLGHFPAAWESPAYLAHLAGGLRWLLGRSEESVGR